jgi:hypothetical protein
MIMVIDPATMAFIASAAAGVAKGIGESRARSKEKKGSQYRHKEMERETLADLFNESSNRGAELHAHNMSTRGKLNKRKAQTHHDTVGLVRGAFGL